MRIDEILQDVLPSNFENWPKSPKVSYLTNFQNLASTKDQLSGMLSKSIQSYFKKVLTTFTDKLSRIEQDFLKTGRGFIQRQMSVIQTQISEKFNPHPIRDNLQSALYKGHLNFDKSDIKYDDQRIEEVKISAMIDKLTS